MQLIRGKHNLREAHRGTVLTIGNYDGVHIGHQAVLRSLTAKAREMGCPATVMVFEPTPREFFMGSNAPARLTTLREKIRRLQQHRVERVLCMPFDRNMASMAPADFIDRLLVRGLGTRHLIVGDDFRFGADRRGDFDTLRSAGRQYGFLVAATPTVAIDGVRVSSSAVRQALAAGDLQSAEHLLGRRYSMSGRVRFGEKLGRQLGYPTANIAPSRQTLPLHGVFAVTVDGPGLAAYPAVASLGTRPTVEGREPLLEVHLFDFDGDLYRQCLEITFVARLRDEQDFPDLPTMVAQMHRDAARARAILKADSSG